MQQPNYLSRVIAAAIAIGIGALLLPSPTSAQGSCGTPIRVAASQSILPPVTVAPGQDLKVHLMNRRNQEVTVAVAYRIPGEEEPIGRTEVTVDPGERGAVPMSSSCLIEDPCIDIICVEARSLQAVQEASTDCLVVEGEDPLQVQAVVTAVYERPVPGFKSPRGFDDPVFGFDDPVFGFDDPVFGFDDPVFGFEVVDTDTGRTAIWGTGGVATGVIPLD